MKFRTEVNIKVSDWKIEPGENMLFVGSCFADKIGQRFADERFRTLVNPDGVMYNPVSILHTIQRLVADGRECDGEYMDKIECKDDNLKPSAPFGVAVFTLGTNHVYRLKESGEIVDNCQKRPQRLFQEEKLNVAACAEALNQAIALLQQHQPAIHIILTVSPIRYAKYGYHESQLSKSTLLLACDCVEQTHPECVSYFPSYEIVNDELRDYRFYAEDMLHPSDQTVSYIWERLGNAYFSAATREYLEAWRPVKEALGHRPFHPEAEAYQRFIQKAQQQLEILKRKYPNMAAK